MNTDVTFHNTRFEPEQTGAFFDLAKQIAANYGYTADLAIDKQLAQLIRLKVAVYNECSYCSILHTQASIDAGISQAKIATINARSDNDLFDAREKACLAYTEVLSDGRREGFATYHEQMKTHFSDEEIALIAATILNMNIRTRFKLAQGQTPVIE